MNYLRSFREQLLCVSRPWRMLLLVLLVAGQFLLLNHVVMHQLEEAFSSDNDHCSFCAIGAHATPATAPPPITPPLFYGLVLCLAFAALTLSGFTLHRIHSRGPPLSVA